MMNMVSSSSQICCSPISSSIQIPSSLSLTLFICEYRPCGCLLYQILLRKFIRLHVSLHYTEPWDTAYNHDDSFSEASDHHTIAKPGSDFVETVETWCPPQPQVCVHGDRRGTWHRLIHLLVWVCSFRSFSAHAVGKSGYLSYCDFSVSSNHSVHSPPVLSHQQHRAAHWMVFVSGSSLSVKKKRNKETPEPVVCVKSQEINSFHSFLLILMFEVNTDSTGPALFYTTLIIAL